VASFLETTIEIAREAGALLLEYRERGVGFELKGDFDLVTEADRASERLIVQSLSAHYPDHSIVAEEGGGHEASSEYRWFVDPVDGTTNFAHGFPAYNVTLALERAGELIAGVIFDPTRPELFAAERGAGAFLNGRPIHVSNVARLEESLVATGFPSQKRHQNVNIHFYYQLGMVTHGVRRAGSAALDLAYVACGRLEAFWEIGLKPWDMAAGILIINEAGGVCSDMNGDAVSLYGPHLLTDNGLIHDNILKEFEDIFAGRYRFTMPGVRADAT
jgi:myo-inositol-1(or 4)-monophosphatase